ncbi:hypothetical protein [Labilithrix luteola]|nr:hypothetical protein [Labilithrix luteola]
MRPVTTRLVSLFIAATPLVGIAACSSSDDDLAQASSAETPQGGSSTKDAGGSKNDADASKSDDEPTTTKDAGKDAKADGSVGDASNDGSTGDPGTPCTSVGEIYERACGVCGKQIASCSPSHVVTGYGACNEPPKACAPGTIETTAACGYCGTTKRTCNNACEWVEEACQGEVTSPTRCLAGTIDNRDEGCAPGIKRPWKCDATCAWTAPTISCEEATRLLVLGETVGSKTTRQFTQLDSKIKRLTSSGTPCKLSTATDSYYAYVEVRNPHAKSAKVDLFVREPAGQPAISVLVSAYATLPDSSAAARQACLTGTELACFHDISYRACLMDDDAVTVPANGSVWVYIGNFDGTDPRATFELTASITAL